MAFRRSQEHVYPLPDRPIVMVRRTEFDRYLLEQSGAEVRFQATVTAVREETHRVVVTTSSDEEWIADYVIGADGGASIVARSLGLRRQRILTLAMAGEVSLDTPGARRWAEAALFEFGAIPWGYLWIFPQGDRLSVGVSIYRQQARHLRATLQQEMRGFGLKLDGVSLRGHPLAIYTGRQQLHSQRCLLVGDAAGLVDPFIGEGIRHALRSGRLAAEAILNDDLPGYSRRVDQEIGRSLRRARQLATFFYRWPKLCYRFGVCNPAVIHRFTELLSGQTDYVALSHWLPGQVLSKSWRSF